MRRIVTAREQAEMLLPWRTAMPWYGVPDEHRGVPMYHSSPSYNRDSIQSQGLTTGFSDDEGIEPGIYMTPIKHDYLDADHDVWQIDTSGLEHLEPDGGYDHPTTGKHLPAYWTRNNIPPHALKRL
ncbi:hypothetical protein BI081_gp245 [Mycobacterium phage Tonenili]|uniref:Uncharacterized protein n=1 Tax=Mycobacterium phage Tonenili TaxID=1891703 RepID=A0A1C9EH91_9CAUD|nr:hypothetical protein BI081_gp245 [Mycobacterium phage Tonenili]AON96862.1 hypothetical protein SEA_TONENILI_115 [Mycobacterium phage Tonenili]